MKNYFLVRLIYPPPPPPPPPTACKLWRLMYFYWLSFFSFFNFFRLTWRHSLILIYIIYIFLICIYFTFYDFKLYDSSWQLLLYCKQSHWAQQQLFLSVTPVTPMCYKRVQELFLHCVNMDQRPSESSDCEASVKILIPTAMLFMRM